MTGAVSAMVGIIGSLVGLKATPTAVFGFATGPGLSGTVVSGSTTITGHSGGVSWARVSGDTTISVSNSTGTTVTFSATVSNGIPKSAVWRCTNGANSTNVSITLQRESNA